MKLYPVPYLVVISIANCTNYSLTYSVPIWGHDVLSKFGFYEVVLLYISQNVEP